MSDAEAQDVVQETIILVARKMPGFKCDQAVGSFKGCLRMLTRRRIEKQLRKGLRKESEPGPQPGFAWRMMNCIENASTAKLGRRSNGPGMKTIIAINVLDQYRVWLSFDDGVEGTVDFSKHVGQGVFAPWTDYAFFRQAALGERGRTLSWPGELDFCADALWLQVSR